MDAELRDHIEREVADLVERGLPAAEARRRALAEFGGIDAVKEAARDARGGRGAEDLVADIAYTFRVFRFNPGPAALAVLTLGVGLGMATAIFSIAYGVLLRPLPYDDPGRLAAIWERNIPRNKDRNVVSIPNFEAWRDANHSFTNIAALMPTTVTVAGGTAPERIAGAEVTPGYFSLLGVLPQFGRDFTEDDARSENAVIVSHAFWTERLGADPSAVGRALLLSEHPYTLVGVMPAAFDPPEFGWLGEQHLWFPMALTPAKRSWGRYLLLAGRLKSGATLASAQTDLETISARREHEPFNAGWSASVVSLRTEIVGDVRTSIIAVLIAVGLLAAMAVANVGTLTLAATSRRSRELAMRRALGATDARLFRQLFTQSAITGAIGAAAGLAVAVPGTRWLVSQMPPDTPRLASIRVDAPVVLVMTLVAAVATIAFGALAARRGCRSASLGLASRDNGDARTTPRVSSGLIVGAEIAFGVAISVMALLMVRSVASLERVDLGFRPDGVIAARIAASADANPTPAAQRAFFDRVTARFRAVPGVAAAGVISSRPFSGIGAADTVHDAGLPNDSASVTADVRVTSNDALAVLGVPLLSGSLFDPLAEASAPPRAVISRTLAQALWPGQNAVGRRLAMNMYSGITPEVIGVVGDVHWLDARTAPRATIYLPVTKFADTERDILIRADAPAGVVIPELRAALTEIAPGLPLYRAAPLSSAIARSMMSDRFTMQLLSVFAVAALLLAGIGVFGVFSADVAARRREIGLRLALGGTAASVIALLLGGAMKRAAAGAVAGVGLALLIARSMTSILFGVGAADPVSLGAVTAGVIALAAAATLIPAAAALRASPLHALREP